MCDCHSCTGRNVEGSYCRGCGCRITNGRCRCGDVGPSGPSSDCPYLRRYK